MEVGNLLSESGSLGLGLDCVRDSIHIPGLGGSEAVGLHLIHESGFPRVFVDSINCVHS